MNKHIERFVDAYYLNHSFKGWLTWFSFWDALKIAWQRRKEKTLEEELKEIDG